MRTTPKERFQDWEQQARSCGFGEFHDTEDGRLIVYRDGDDVHYYSWKDAVIYGGKLTEPQS